MSVICPVEKSESHSSLREDPDNIIIQDHMSSWRFQMNMTIFLLFYTFGGAWIFQQLESRAEIQRVEYDQSILVSGRSKLLDTIAKLDHFSTNDSQSAKYNETLRALQEYEAAIDLVLDSRPTLNQFLNETKGPTLEWSNYLHVYYFVLTLISTIGYGNLAPRTTWGRIFCVVYGMIGIPVLLIFIAQAGKILAKFSISILTKIFGRHIGSAYFASGNTRSRKMLGTSISLSGVIFLVFIYMAFGALIINSNESWGFVNSFYFCFITLTTVGFGDLIPLGGQVSQAPYLLLFVRSIYTLFGLAITSTAIALLQKQYAETWAKKAARRSDTKEAATTIQQVENLIIHAAGQSCKQYYDYKREDNLETNEVLLKKRNA